MISDEISNQISRKLNAIESSLKSQMQDAITTAIAEKVLSSIQDTRETQGRANYTIVDRLSSGLQESPRATNFTMMDRRSGGLQRNPAEVENTQKTWEHRPKTCIRQRNCRRMSKESTVDSYTSKQNCENTISALSEAYQMLSESLRLPFQLFRQSKATKLKVLYNQKSSEQGQHPSELAIKKHQRRFTI